MTNQTATVPSFIFNESGFQPPSFCGLFERPFGSNELKLQKNGGFKTSNLTTERQELDKLLAVKMNGLSVKDRETILEEVNGIAQSDPEEPSRLRSCLAELDEHLKERKGGTFYEIAEKMDSNYVSNRRFRVMFLRAKRYTTPEGENRYDPKKAAELMLGFFSTKHTLFGREKLVKDITLSDLTPDDREGLAKGGMQVLPTRDMTGRKVVISFRGFARFKDDLSEVRAKYYTYMSLMDCEETQKKGVVTIFYAVGQCRDSKKGGNIAAQGKLLMNLPVHCAATQVCFDDYKQYILLRAFLQIAPAQFAAKVRVHFGTHLECQYTLQGYGIPRGSIPISLLDSTVLLHNHLRWYEQQEALDKERFGRRNHVCPTFQAILSSCGTHGIHLGEMDDGVFSLDPFIEKDTLPSAPKFSTQAAAAEIEPSRLPNGAISPRSTDILFGQCHKSHPGNLRFHEFITQHADDYEAAIGRQNKIEFAEYLVQLIKAGGSRFLIYDKGMMQWVEVFDTKARNKVSKTIRNRRRSAGE